MHNWPLSEETEIRHSGTFKPWPEITPRHPAAVRQKTGWQRPALRLTDADDVSPRLELEQDGSRFTHGNERYAAHAAVGGGKGPPP